MLASHYVMLAVNALAGPGLAQEERVQSRSCCINALAGPGPAQQKPRQVTPATGFMTDLRTRLG